MGARATVKPDGEQGVSFVLGADKLHVLILTPDDMTRRNAILDSILTLSTLQLTYELVYLAAPRIFGTAVDASIFKSRGVGLLFYDERRIDEAVPARLQTEAPAKQTQVDGSGLVTEFAVLKTMYLEMERTVNQLRNDLTILRIPQPVQQPEPRALTPAQGITMQPNFPQAVIHGGELPSYFMNNPWLDVLSKRRTGDREPIAG